jgi:hypothetical protein
MGIVINLGHRKYIFFFVCKRLREQNKEEVRQLAVNRAGMLLWNIPVKREGRSSWSCFLLRISQQDFVLLKVEQPLMYELIHTPLTCK